MLGDEGLSSNGNNCFEAFKLISHLQMYMVSAVTNTHTSFE